jgi:hypothetical protein
MKKSFFHVILLISVFYLSGCAAQLMKQVKTLEGEWGKDNKQLQDKLGMKYFDDLPKEKAMNAIAVTFQRLDLITENADYKTGIMIASAKSPRPLTHEELEIVEKEEDARARRIIPYGFSWDATNNYTNIFNATLLETGEGVQISLRMRMEYVGTNPYVIPITEPPPKALEIFFAKFWDEFEKIVFIQNKTLKRAAIDS